MSDHVPTAEPRFHGEQLDTALDTAGPSPELLTEHYGICETALRTRIAGICDQQQTFFADDFEDCRAMLAESGGPTDDASVAQVQLRAVVGGSFTLGLALGLALAEQAGWRPDA